MSPKMQSKQNTRVLFGFLILVCVNVCVLFYISKQMTENQVQFEMFRRTDEFRHFQELRDQEKQYRTMEMIQSVHFGKTVDQRRRDEYEQVYTKKYADIPSLGGWVINMRHQIEENLAVQNHDEHNLINVDDQNMLRRVLKIKDEKEQYLNKQDQNMQHQIEEDLGVQNHDGHYLINMDDQNMLRRVFKIKDEKEQYLNKQDQNMQHQIEENLAVQNHDEHYLINVDDQNMLRWVLKIRDEQKQDEKAQYSNKQEQNVQDEEKHGINIQYEKDQDDKVQDNETLDLSRHGDMEESDLSVLQGEEDKYKAAEVEENQDTSTIKYQEEIVLDIQDPGANYPNMEYGKKVLDNNENGEGVADQEHYQDKKGKEMQDNIKEQDIEKKGLIVEGQKEDDPYNILNLAEGQKKHDQDMQYEKEPEIRTS